MTHSRSDLKSWRAKHPEEIIFDGLHVTAAGGPSNTVRVQGHSVSHADAGMYLVIRGGTDFVIGSYRILVANSSSSTWTLDRPCCIGPGAGMRGKAFHQQGRWYGEVEEYYDPTLPDNPGRGESRDKVLAVLDVLEPDILKSLAETCFKRTLLEPEIVVLRDWCGPCDELLWGHLRNVGDVEPSAGEASLGNLKPLREALTHWARGGLGKRWNLCDNNGSPLDWIAEAAVQTLVWWNHKGRLPKVLRWENLDFHVYRSLARVEDYRMFHLERHLDAGAGFARIVPENGPESSRLSDRDQRVAKREYKELGLKRDLTRMERLSPRYLEWYALRTFLGWKLREIRERELRMRRSGVGDPKDPQDLSAISHAIRKIADLVGFSR